jgi:hypothetical protein
VIISPAASAQDRYTVLYSRTTTEDPSSETIESEIMSDEIADHSSGIKNPSHDSKHCIR